ncbi:hypothetical protein MUU49_06210 [Scandinavium goeteborgense]|uniref:YeeE/YedE thiosulfate transporter family protein n=1 Tax=Scandinavium goeteborgense TaxID=1851514 RepID=UPI0021668EB7|nr:hypothetical protein [Scandinavium goeteborgense]MCS2152177.1 hypothetical protein [Scandinavium goeteborgense]
MKAQKRHHLSHLIRLLVPGLTFGFLYVSDADWSLSQLLNEIYQFFHHGTPFRPSHLFKLSAFIAGMRVFTLWHRRFTVSRFSILRSLRHFCAGLIMLTGARMMGGGNDNLLFIKLPSLTPQALLTVLVLIASTVVTRVVIKKYYR